MAQQGSQAFGHGFSVGRRGDIGLQNGEFIAREPRDQIRAANRPRKPPRRGAQQFLLRGMAKVIGHMAEAIKVKHMHGNPGWAAAWPDQCRGDTRGEHGEISQPRDPVRPAAPRQVIATLDSKRPCAGTSVANGKAKARRAIQDHFPIIFHRRPGGCGASLHQGGGGVRFQTRATIQQVRQTIKARGGAAPKAKQAERPLSKCAYLQAGIEGQAIIHQGKPPQGLTLGA